MEISAVKLYELLKASVGANEAQEIIRILRQEAEKNLQEGEREIFVTKQHLKNANGKLIRAIYLISIVQIFAIVTSVVGLLFILLKK